LQNNPENSSTWKSVKPCSCTQSHPPQLTQTPEKQRIPTPHSIGKMISQNLSGRPTGAHHDSPPGILCEHFRLYCQQAWDPILDGKPQAFIRICADQGICILHKFGMALRANQNSPGFFNGERHIFTVSEKQNFAVNGVHEIMQEAYWTAVESYREKSENQNPRNSRMSRKVLRL
jgi:hypothetical protein